MDDGWDFTWYRIHWVQGSFQPWSWMFRRMWRLVMTECGLIFFKSLLSVQQKRSFSNCTVLLLPETQFLSASLSVMLTESLSLLCWLWPLCYIEEHHKRYFSFALLRLSFSVDCSLEKVGWCEQPALAVILIIKWQTLRLLTAKVIEVLSYVAHKLGSNAEAVCVFVSWELTSTSVA